MREEYNIVITPLWQESPGQNYVKGTNTIRVKPNVILAYGTHRTDSKYPQFETALLLHSGGWMFVAESISDIERALG